MNEPQKMNFIIVGQAKKPSKTAIRDLIYYLKRKKNLEKQYSRSSISFP